MLLRENICDTAWKFKYICILLQVNKTFIQESKLEHRNRVLLFQMHRTQILTQKRNPKQSSLDPENANTCKQPVSFLLMTFSTYIQMWMITCCQHPHVHLLSVESLHNHFRKQLQRQKYLSKPKAASLLIWLGGFLFSPLGQTVTHFVWKSKPTFSRYFEDIHLNS